MRGRWDRGEQKIAERLDLAQALRRAKEILAEGEIKPESFTDLYGSPNIQRDLQTVREREAAFAKERAQGGDGEQEKHDLATIFEGITLDCIECYGWFGRGASAIRPSRYDDIENGVDAIAEFNREALGVSHLALAIDVTFDPYAKEKFEAIKKEIRENRLTRIKYFRSRDGSFRGEKNLVPRVVVGLDPKTVKSLGAVWLEKKQTELEEHPVQMLMLEQVQRQLALFERYAENGGHSAAAAAYRQASVVVADIIARKAWLAEKREKEIGELRKSDKVYGNIDTYLDRFEEGRAA